MNILYKPLRLHQIQQGFSLYQNNTSLHLSVGPKAANAYTINYQKNSQNHILIGRNKHNKW